MEKRQILFRRVPVDSRVETGLASGNAFALRFVRIFWMELGRLSLSRVESTKGE